MENVAIMMAVLFGCIALGAPIGVALMAASGVILLIEPNFDAFLLARRFYSNIDSFVLLAAPLFLLAGMLMNETGITARLLALSQALVGHLRGGLAHVNVLVSMLFAGISGSSSADTAGVGSVMIPAMIRRGYTPSISVAVTAASSVLGGVIPPSIFFVIWGTITGTSVAALFAGGIAPGLLIGLAQMGYVGWRARREDWPVERRADWAETGVAFRRALLGLGAPVIIVGGIVFGVATPTEASILAVGYALAVGILVYRNLSFARAVATFHESARLIALALFCYGAAGLFGWLLAFHQLPMMLVAWTGESVPPALVLPLFALVCLVLGTFLDPLVIAIIIGPLFMPAMVEAGVDPVHFGVVACVALTIGIVTPPYGLCLLIACSIADLPMHEALRDTLAIFAVVCVVLAAIVLIPAISTFLPGLLL